MTKVAPRILAIGSSRHPRIAGHVRVAMRFRERLRGLLGTKCLLPGQGLWIEPGGSVHTIGMRYAIDVVFVDRAGTVLRVLRNLRPFRFGFAPRGCRAVLELAAGSADPGVIRAGDQLSIAVVADRESSFRERAA